MSSYTLTAVVTVAVVVASTEANRLVNVKWNAEHSKEKPRKIIGAMSPVLAGFALGFFLFAAGMANEHLATLLCLLIATSAILLNGIPLFSLLTTLK